MFDLKSATEADVFHVFFVSVAFSVNTLDKSGWSQ